MRFTSFLRVDVNPRRVASVREDVVHGVSTTTLTRPVIDQQQAAGAALQVVLFAVLATGVGLGAVGWLVGLAYTGGLWLGLAAAARRARVDALGPADLVTLTRAALVGGVTALVADGHVPQGLATARLDGGGTVVAILVVIATVALALDAVDGKVARRTRTVSALGARFDMEVDAFLVLVLSVHVAVHMGPWVLVIGAMRYVFVAVSWAMPWLRAALPTRYSAKVVAALQGIVLVVATAGILPPALTVALVSMALALLVWSFGHDVVWLRRNARHLTGDRIRIGDQP